MPRRCELTGRKVTSGNNVSHSNRRTRRTFGGSRCSRTRSATPCACASRPPRCGRYRSAADSMPSSSGWTTRSFRPRRSRSSGASGARSAGRRARPDARKEPCRVVVGPDTEAPALPSPAPGGVRRRRGAHAPPRPPPCPPAAARVEPGRLGRNRPARAGRRHPRLPALSRCGPGAHCHARRAVPAALPSRGGARRARPARPARTRRARRPRRRATPRPACLTFHPTA
jgi:hypothetical protein